MNYRSIIFTTVIFATLLQACTSPAPVPEPGLEILRHARNEEMQVAPDVDWSSYNKIILHAAPVEFADYWKETQERNLGRTLQEEDLERFRTTMSDQLSKVMVKKLSASDKYELTSESGPGVMRFIPRIVDLDIRAPGWVQSTIVETMVNSRGSMTLEVVIRDSVSNELMGVAWQYQDDPQEGYMEMTNVVNNTVAFRLMMQRWADWLFKQIDKAGA